MSLVQQISRNRQTIALPAASFFDKFTKQNAPTRPSDGSIFSQAWTPYEQQLHFFESISDSDFHTVHNQDGRINTATALSMLHAILQGKPIVLLAAPTFDAKVGAFAQRAIKSRLSQMKICDFNNTRREDLANFLKDFNQPVDYKLSEREKVLIGSQLKAHFRELLAISTNADANSERIGRNG